MPYRQELNEWHSKYGGLRWRVSPEGVVTEDSPDTPHRTPGRPRTIVRYLNQWTSPLITYTQIYQVPLSLLLMTLATENGPAYFDQQNNIKIRSIRKEPGYVSDKKTPHRISVGPGHLLISSAREAMDDDSIDRSWLLDIENNIRAMSAEISMRQDDHPNWDPIKVAAAYNAGGLYKAIPGESRFGNRWHLRTYGNHLDRASAWYGDACAVIKQSQFSGFDDVGLGRVVV